MEYSASEIADIIGAKTPKFPNLTIDTLLTDSRSLCQPTRSLFFALRTTTGDGHRFIRELYDSGVRNFVVETIPPEASSVMLDANFIEADNSLKALQAIGNKHRNRFDIPIIGITGSRGKTIIKEWLYQALSPDYRIVRSPRSYNSQIGVPLSVWELDTDTSLGIFEAGVSQKGEMSVLRNIIRPTIGIFTNIGSEHGDGFADSMEKCREKALLFSDCDYVVFNSDHKEIANALKISAPDALQFTWSTTDPAADLYITDNGSAETTFIFNGNRHSITMPSNDPHMVENACHTLATALCIGISPECAAARIAALTPVSTRLNVIEGVSNCLLINDGYTADVHSLAPALDFMHRRMTSKRSATIILSDLAHEQMSAAKAYRHVADMLNLYAVNRIIGIGAEITAHRDYFGSNASFYPSTADFLAQTTTGDFENELILIKGKPDFEFCRIVQILEARHHETVLEVNLDAVVHNYNHFRAMLRPETGMVIMVKASGYGAGAYELAKTLQAQRAAYLAVAVTDEGIELRQAGITMPIMVMNPKVVNYTSMFAYRLEPEIFSFGMLDEMIVEARKRGISDYPVHLKIDSGMHRLGFLEKDIPAIIDRFKSSPEVRLESVFSHLAAADCPDLDDYTMQQFRMFDSCCAKLRAGLPEVNFKRHILNSTGITRFADHQYEMVRLGIGLYGIPTLDTPEQHGLRPVSTLRTIIISIKEWPAGTTIGYGCRGVLTRPSRIATIPVGYADGIDRHLGYGNASFWVNGHRCPTVGSICMDACMIDVTDTDCNEGDAVEIFGNNVPAAELAEILGTIPYEIISTVSNRVKRVYYRE